MKTGRLTTGHEQALEDFLSAHAETSMYLRGNARKVGLEYQEKDFHAEYFAIFDGSGAITAVIAHGKSGRVLVQCPDSSAIGTMTAFFREQASRPVTGFLGPDEQVSRFIRDLALEDLEYAMDKNERLYGLDLDSLRPAPSPGNARVEVVEAGQCDSLLLSRWVRENELETQGAEDNEDLDREVEWQVGQIMRENHWVLLADGEPVSLSGFTSRLPDIVQVGGVWTPPVHRNQGHARRLVAMSLQMAREERVRKSVLFTDNPAAVKAYAAIGFRPVGHYRIALLKSPVALDR